MTAVLYHFLKSLQCVCPFLPTCDSDTLCIQLTKERVRSAHPVAVAIARGKTQVDAFLDQLERSWLRNAATCLVTLVTPSV
jgi:hypothetical protein